LFEQLDEQCMRLALEQARTALAEGNYPVGAVLTVDGEIWGTARNSLFTDGRTTAHAEHKLIAECSARLRLRWAQSVPTVCLYTTLEPCLMCLGISVMHRVSRIVVACPDPDGGSLGLDPSTLGTVYAGWWPQMQAGLGKEESCALIIEFLQRGKFRAGESMLQAFRAMQRACGEAT
jgi:tRNA(adenine34) deaminase